MHLVEQILKALLLEVVLFRSDNKLLQFGGEMPQHDYIQYLYSMQILFPFYLLCQDYPRHLLSPTALKYSFQPSRQIVPQEDVTNDRSPPTPGSMEQPSGEVLDLQQRVDNKFTYKLSIMATRSRDTKALPPPAFCQHRNYEKIREQRVRKISDQFPKRYLQVQVNPTLKIANKYKSNIPTLAYEKYILQELDLGKEQNFVKDFYQSPQIQLQTDVNIIELTEKHLEAGNAYVLCEVERGEFKERERKRVGTIMSARKKAVSHYNEHFEEKKEDAQQNEQDTKKYLKKLYTKLEEVADHIVRGTGEGKSDREKQFLLTKDYLNSSYLANIKIRKPNNVIEILEEIRVLLQKHKLKHETERQQIEANKSMTQSFMTQASGQSGANDSQSRISDAYTVEGSQLNTEDALINKYCNLVELQKKWKKSSIQQVKHVIRRVVMNKLLLEAQKKALRDKLKEKQINQSLKASNPDLAKKLQEKERKQRQAAKEKQKQTNTSALSTNQKQSKQDQPVILNSAQNEVKEQWMKSGKYNPPGELFEKTNNYTKMFEQKFKQSMFSLQHKDQEQGAQQTDCECTCKCPCSS